MSYILDALRRADAERRRGAVPTLNAQPASLDPTEAEPAPVVPRWSWIVAVGAVGVLVPIVMLMRGVPPTAAPAIEQQAAAAKMQAPAPVLPVPAPAARKDTPAMAAPAPVARPASPPLATSVVKSKPGSQPDPATAARPGQAAAAAAAEPEPRVVPLSELPEEVRRGLPALAVTGTMYSDNPANRMVVINGRLLRENDPLSPELTLEQIRRQSVVLRYLGHRFEVANP